MQAGDGNALDSGSVVEMEENGGKLSTRGRVTRAC